MNTKLFFGLITIGLLLAPQATAHQTEQGTTSTGDVDVYLEDYSWLQSTFCTRDIYWFTVTLELLDATPGDRVALSVSGDLTTTAPSDVATFDDPTAEVTVQLGGCNRATTAIVTGLTVTGELDYNLTY